MRDIASSYYASLKAALEYGPPGELEDVVDLLFAAFLRRSHVYTLGNGASAALGAHMACDWGMSCATDLGRSPTQIAAPRLQISSLPDSGVLVTGYSNDYEFSNVFVEQLKCVADEGDVVVAISGSGASVNVLRAAEYARTRGATVIGFTSIAPSARALASRCDVTVRAPVARIQETEDLHVAFNHIVALTLERRVREHLGLGPAPAVTASSEAEDLGDSLPLDL